jgi:hypothetical protein
VITIVPTRSVSGVSPLQEVLTALCPLLAREHRLLWCGVLSWNKIDKMLFFGRFRGQADIIFISPAREWDF